MLQYTSRIPPPKSAVVLVYVYPKFLEKTVNMKGNIRIDTIKKQAPKRACRPFNYQEVMKSPPFTWIACPVTYVESFEAR